MLEFSRPIFADRMHAFSFRELGSANGNLDRKMKKYNEFYNRVHRTNCRANLIEDARDVLHVLDVCEYNQYA